MKLAEREDQIIRIQADPSQSDRAYAEDRVVQIDAEKGRENSPVLKTKVS